MAKIGDKNKRLRSGEQMAMDIATVLNQEGLSYGARYDVIHGVTWQFSQRNGIYRGNQVWSKRAIDFYNANHTESPSTELSKYFREEHIVPRKIIIDHLIDLDIPVEWEYIERYLNKYLKSIVLTIEENKAIDRKYKTTMPPHIDCTLDFDEWARYRETEIVRMNIKWVKKSRKLVVFETLEIIV